MSTVANKTEVVVDVAAVGGVDVAAVGGAAVGGGGVAAVGGGGPQVSLEVVEEGSVSVDMGEKFRYETVLLAPNGGFYAIRALVACFVISFFSAGYTRVFLAAVLKSSPGSGLGDSAWIRAGPTTLPLLLAPLTGMFLDRFGHRATFATGYSLAALAMALGYFAASVGPLTSFLSVLLGLGLALASTAMIDSLKKYFTTFRPLAMTLNKLAGQCGGVAATYGWVEPLLEAVGCSGAWLVWCGMFVAFLVFGVFVFVRPEDHFILETKEVLVTDAPLVESEEVVPSSDFDLPTFVTSMAGKPGLVLRALSRFAFFVERSYEAVVGFLGLLSAKLGFGFLANPRFVLVVAITVCLGLGNSSFSSSTQKRTGAVFPEHKNTSNVHVAVLAVLAESLFTLFYGMCAKFSPLARNVEFSIALVVAAFCSGLPLVSASYPAFVSLAVFSGAAGAFVKALPPLVLIESHGAGNLVGTLNVVKMFDGVTKILYPHLAALMAPGVVPVFNAGATGFSAVLGLVLSSGYLFSWLKSSA